MYFEIFKQGNLIIRGKTYTGTLQFDHELNLAPTTTMVLPADWATIISGREEIKIHLDDGKVFWGIIWNFSPIDKVNETITLDIRHVVTEWQYRQISVNHAISGSEANAKLNVVFKGDKTNKNSSNGEAITASDFTVIAKKIDKMKLADWISKASAQAWSTTSGDKVAITSADTTDIETEDDDGKKVYKEGTYKVKFSTAKGTKVTVDCTVVQSVDYGNPKTHSDKNNGETISARPFSVYVDEGFTVKVVKEKVKAKAWVYKHKDQEVPVTSITTNFKNEVGTYTVTASTAQGTSITVRVTVEDGTNYSNVSDPSIVDKLEDIYNDTNFAYPGWEIEWLDGADDRVIDYVYSKQNKLDALTETVELTDDLWWRVGFWDEKKLQIGKFGTLKPYIISKKPSGNTNIRMIQEPSIEPDLENVINVATVYSDKSDGGMTSLTLREAYMDEKLLADGIINSRIQKSGFPVVILHSNVNNERDYRRYVSQFPKLAPNNELEYAVLDEESIALESGILIEGSYSFNDLSPFELDGKTISDKKRARAARTVYNAVVKKLIQSRRSYDIKLTTEHLPIDLLAGDKVRLIYDNKIWEQHACSNRWKKILSLNDSFYITHITYNIDEYGNEWNELTLTKWLKIERETANTQG